MKKKGIVSGVIISWALGLLVVSIVIWVIVGPDKLLAKTKDLAFGFGLGTLPEEKVPEFAGVSDVPAALVQYFNTLVSAVSPPFPEGDRCLIDIGAMPELKDHRIFLKQGSIEIERRTLSRSPTGIIKEINGFRPCFVVSTPALDFHKCYMVENKKDACKNELTRPSGSTHLETNDYSKYLFKDGQDICFIKFYNDKDALFGLSGLLRFCDSPREGGKDGIDNDCKKKIKELYEKIECGGSVSAPILSSTPNLASPLDGKFTSETPVLLLSSTGASAYHFYARKSAETPETASWKDCSPVNSKQFQLPDGIKYFWSAKFCSDSSCNNCGSYAAERSFIIEHIATESTDGWSSSSDIITDGTVKQSGLVSIKMSGSNLIGKSATYTFESSVALNKISFFAKSSSKSSEIRISLTDSSGNQVKIKTRRSLFARRWHTIELVKNDFELLSASFDWNKINKIIFENRFIGPPFKELWIDSLQISSPPSSQQPPTQPAPTQPEPTESPSPQQPDFTIVHITTDSSPKGNPDIFGNKIVWDKREGPNNYNIYMYDLGSDGKFDPGADTGITKITNVNSNSQFASIYQNKIVWQDDREQPYRPHVYIYDLGDDGNFGTSDDIKTIKTLKISGIDGEFNEIDGDFPYSKIWQRQTKIYGDKVVWNNRNGFISTQNYWYDIQNKNMQYVNPSTGRQGWPKIYANKIIWEENNDIYIYDIDNGKINQIASGSAVQRDADVQGNKVVYVEDHNTIKLYDLSNDQVTEIITKEDSINNLEIYGEKIVYESPWGTINMYDLVTKVETQLSSDGANPAIYGDKVVWAEKKGTNSYDIYMAVLN